MKPSRKPSETFFTRLVSLLTAEVFLCSSILPVWAAPTDFLRPKVAAQSFFSKVPRQQASDGGQARDGGVQQTFKRWQSAGISGGRVAVELEELGPGAVDEITTALGAEQYRPYGEFREGLAEALGRIGHPASLFALIKALEEDPDGNVRAKAAEALETLRNPSAVPRLRQAVKTERDPVALIAIANALKRLKDPSAIADLEAVLPSWLRYPSVRKAINGAVADLNLSPQDRKQQRHLTSVIVRKFFDDLNPIFAALRRRLSYNSIEMGEETVKIIYEHKGPEPNDPSDFLEKVKVFYQKHRSLLKDLIEFGSRGDIIYTPEGEAILLLGRYGSQEKKNVAVQLIDAFGYQFGGRDGITSYSLFGNLYASSAYPPLTYSWGGEMTTTVRIGDKLREFKNAPYRMAPVRAIALVTQTNQRRGTVEATHDFSEFAPFLYANLLDWALDKLKDRPVDPEEIHLIRIGVPTKMTPNIYPKIARETHALISKGIAQEDPFESSDGGLRDRETHPLEFEIMNPTQPVSRYP